MDKNRKLLEATLNKHIFNRFDNVDRETFYRAMNEYAMHFASLAWDESLHTFAKECGHDVSEIEEHGPIYQNKKDFMTKNFE